MAGGVHEGPTPSRDFYKPVTVQDDAICHRDATRLGGTFQPSLRGR